jgi:hypothetical protein
MALYQNKSREGPVIELRQCKKGGREDLLRVVLSNAVFCFPLGTTARMKGHRARLRQEMWVEQQAPVF